MHHYTWLWGVGARHHPSVLKVNPVCLAARVGVVYKQLAVLGRAHQMLRVFTPLHRIDLVQVTIHILPSHQSEHDCRLHNSNSAANMRFADRNSANRLALS